MSDSVQPHRRQPARLRRPWDSPGKNTGVGCHFPLQCIKVKSKSEVSQSCLTPSDPMDCSLPGSSVHGICQARVLEWAAIAFSKLCCCVCCILILGYITSLGRMVAIQENSKGIRLVKVPAREFPGSPVVTTWPFHCSALGFDPWWGN